MRFFEHWRKYFSISAREKQSGHETQLYNFETDPIRFIYEAHLKEYESTVSNIRLRIELAEQIFNYLLLLVGALLSASQLFSEQTARLLEFLNSLPSIYLLLSLLSLLFPLNMLGHELHIATMGSYVNHVLSPKIRAISTRLSRLSENARQYIEWENIHYPAWLQGPMRFEDFRPREEYRRAIIVFSVIATFKYAFVSFPFFLLVSAFLSAKSNIPFWHSWTLAEKILGLINLGIVAAGLIGILQGVISYSIASIKERIFPKDNAR